jgi:hypothetical protein
MGNGESTLFWKDRWLHGHTISELAPNLIKAIPKRTINRRTVAQALPNRCWVNDIRGAHSVQLLVDYFYIWDLMEGVVLTQDVPDQVRWKLTQSRVYRNKSALCRLNGQNHKVCSEEKDLEKLGSSSLQVLHLVSYQ